MPTKALRVQVKLQRTHYTLDVDLTLPAQGITVLFGASGCGKTSLLRCVAGLEKPQSGLIALAGQAWQDTEQQIFVPTWQRSLGYVFQEASLFAHLTVRDNLQYGFVRAQKHRQLTDAAMTPDALMTRLGIDHLADRYAHQLSGGERQRASMARALVTQPSLLLLDEPLASLDIRRRHDILEWFQQWRETLDIPMLYVTHSTQELEALADHVVVLEQGKVVAEGSLQTVTQSRQTNLLHELRDTTYLTATVDPATLNTNKPLNTTDSLFLAQTELGVIRLNHWPSQRAQTRLCVRPSQITLSRKPLSNISCDNELQGTIQTIEAHHSNSRLYTLTLLCNNTQVRAVISRAQCQTLGFKSEQAVFAYLHDTEVL
ncbi:molybdenum ABC transporter ATP-binding protein [Orrella sp. 11846]|uniref:molybdenum ABC transporter ATP-binding protein n=1 Tax=Orrella sp. 11846 TaxID=3409913 RepID=UPI003B5BA8C3